MLVGITNTMFHRDQVPVSTNPFNAFARARERFKSVISQERHAILKKSSALDLDYDSGSSDFEGILLEAPKKQKLNFDSVPCKKTGFNLKLFDRQIDVAQFKEDSSLYPVCREWIKNPPDPKKPSTENRKTKKESARNKESDSTEEENAIHELPAPKSLPYDMLGNPISIRLPSILTSLKVENAHESIWDLFDGNPPDENRSLPSPAILFQSHLDRWNLVKKRWRLAAKADNRRYKKSFDLIDEAFRDTPSPSD